MKIKLFYAPGCAKCAAATVALKAETIAAVPGVEWLEVNVLDCLDRAVELGVLTLPALAVDGELAFAALPSPGLTPDRPRRQSRRAHGRRGVALVLGGLQGPHRGGGAVPM